MNLPRVGIKDTPTPCPNKDRDVWPILILINFWPLSPQLMGRQRSIFSRANSFLLLQILIPELGKYFFTPRVLRVLYLCSLASKTYSLNEWPVLFCMYIECFYLVASLFNHAVLFWRK